MTVISLRLLFLSILLPIFGYSAEPPKASKGFLDLTGWDFIEKGPTKLEGEWEFYWNQLLTPTDFSSSSIKEFSYQIFPAIWNKYLIGDQVLPRYGFATYRLRVKVDDSDGRYAIKMGEVLTAYRIWLNGEEICKSGVVGKQNNTSTPKYTPQTTQFETSENEIEVVLQVSNFHYKDGGSNSPIQLGLGAELVNSRENSLVLHYILFGSVFVMGLYHLALSFLNKNNKPTLLFGLFSLIIASRILVTDESFIIHIIPTLTWEIHLKMIVLGYYVAFIIFLDFIYYLYEEEFSQKIVKVLLLAGGALSLFVLITPARIYTHTEVYYQVYILISSVYILKNIFSAIRNGRGGAKLILAGFFMLLVAVVNDILYAQYLSNIQSLVPFALFGFIFLQAYIIAKHFSRAVTLSEELAVTNQELQESNNTKDKFFSIIAHDLRGPIGNMMQFSELAMDKDLLTEDELNEILSSQKKIATNTYQLLDNLLNWARVNSQRMQFHPDLIELNPVINENIRGIETIANEKGILLASEFQETYKAYADKDIVSFIIRNLLSNAIKFTSKNGIISIGLKDENGHIRVTISDSGVGITQENIQSILSKTEYFTTRGTRNEKGTGLGLKLCKSFIEKNGGYLKIKSVINEGTSFSFTIPKAKS